MSRMYESNALAQRDEPAVVPVAWNLVVVQFASVPCRVEVEHGDLQPGLSVDGIEIAHRHQAVPGWGDVDLPDRGDTLAPPSPGDLGRQVGRLRFPWLRPG